MKCLVSVGLPQCLSVPELSDDVLCSLVSCLKVEAGVVCLC